MSNPTHPSVQNFYNSHADGEHVRLESNPLEFHITQRTISALLHSSSPSVAEIADIGGGTGVHALPLAAGGHRVSFCDLSPEQVTLCSQTAASRGVKLECCVTADATALERCVEIWRPAAYDGVLLLGPLYHLTAERDRVKCLSDCAELLKPGGWLIAAVVNKVAHLRDLAGRDPARLEREWDTFYERYVNVSGDGVYDRNKDGPVGWHTDPEGARKLIDGIDGLKVEKCVAAEGILGGVGTGLKGLGPKEMERWVDVCLEGGRSETEGALGSADRVLVVARKLKG